MTEAASPPRPRRPPRSGAFLICALLAAAGAGHAGAQEPDTVPAPPPDTVPAPRGPDTIPDPGAPDTIPEKGPPGRGDTVPGRRPSLTGDAAQDTVPSDTVPQPPPALPALEPIGPPGWARGVWEWDREEMERFPDVSLLQLLERVPGVVPVRTDLANQPEWAAVLGATAGGIRYVVDGFELDPLASPTFEPARLALLALERVRVERHPSGTTVRVWTMRPATPEPESIVEAGTGDLDLNMFRGLFLAPRIMGGPLGLGFERLAADGLIPGGSSNHTVGWLKWSWIRGTSGAQLEYRQSSMDRSGVGDALSGTLTHWALRARTELGPVTGEVYAGGANLQETVGELTVDEGTLHGGLRLRAGLDAPFPIEASTAFRLRDHPRLPTMEVETEVRAIPSPRVALEAAAGAGSWGNGPGTGHWSARTVVGPFLNVSAFAGLFGGPLLGDGVTVRFPSPDAAGLRATRTGARVGAELALGRARIGVAGLRVTADTIPGMGLAPEPDGLGTSGAGADGLEVSARLPTGWAPLTVRGWWVGMDRPADWLYLPAHQARATLEYHHLPLESGNLEIFARLEHAYRGAMAVPVAGQDGTAIPALTQVPAYRATDFELSIRVVTVRAFIRWQNLLHRLGQQDLPGFQRPGQNVLYGVKWHFLN